MAIDTENLYDLILVKFGAADGTNFQNAFFYAMRRVCEDLNSQKVGLGITTVPAIKATDLYAQATAEHDEDLVELVEQHLNPLDPDRFQRCRSADESKRLNHRREPAVIVAASGMATGGRVVHHLKHRLSNERNAVIFVGYQAAGTRGRALVEGARMVAIHGSPIPVRAEIRLMVGLSAHADQQDLLNFIRRMRRSPASSSSTRSREAMRRSCR